MLTVLYTILALLSNILMKQDVYAIAIKKLYSKRNFTLNDTKYTLANIIRDEDHRPLEAPWWKGKQVTVIAIDMYGNFILRHSSGAVSLWEHKLQKDNPVSKSVKDFFNDLEIDDVYTVAAPTKQVF